MSAWLSKLDPNVIVPVIVALVTYGYHALFSPATQQKIQATLESALGIADQVMSSLVAVAPAGTTRAQLEEQLWLAAKIQLQHIGLDPDKLPAAATAAAKALVDKWLTEHEAKQAKPSP